MMADRKTVVTIRPRVLPEDAAAIYIGVSTSTLQKLVRDGKLQKPRQVSAARVAYEVADLDEYLDTCPRSTLKPGPGQKAPQGEPQGA
jgi:predicted DNA-binding transcriptional regulator AlpA